MYPSHVVVDTTDGYPFFSDGQGKLFNLEAAIAFADKRNSEIIGKWESASPRYQVFALTPVTEEHLFRWVRQFPFQYIGGCTCKNWQSERSYNKEDPIFEFIEHLSDGL